MATLFDSQGVFTVHASCLGKNRRLPFRAWIRATPVVGDLCTQHSCVPVVLIKNGDG